MIRVITIDELDPKVLEKFCKILYTAFAVGSEHSGSVRMPDGITEPIEAGKFLELAQGVRAYGLAKQAMAVGSEASFTSVTSTTSKSPILRYMSFAMLHFVNWSDAMFISV